MLAKKIRYKGATYVLAESYSDHPATIEVHVSCTEGDPISGDCTYTARIVGTSDETGVPGLEAWGVKQEIKAKNGIEALRKMADNWELSGFLQ